MYNATIRSQSYAVTIEHILEDVLECNRFDMAGVVNSDFIRKNPLAAILTVCGYLYADTNKRLLVDKFIEETSFYLKMSIDELLSFESNNKVVDGCEIELDYENGEAALIDVIEKFKKLCE